MKKIFLFTLLLFTSLLIFADEVKEYRTETGIAYRRDGAECCLDVYYPLGGKNCPVLVWFHGGGLTKGSRYVPEELKESGIVVVAVDYRLMPGVGISDCIDDAAAAVAWTFCNIAGYGGDSSKIFVCGHSAGGYLTDMVGLDKKWLAAYGIDANRIAGLIPLSGQAITHYALRRQRGIDDLQATIDEFAPLTHIRADVPDMLIVSGDREMEMNGRYEEQAYFWRMLKLKGAKNVRLYEIQGFSHGDMRHPAMHIVKKFISEKTAAK